MGTEVTTSDNFRASFNILSLSQVVHSMFAADERTTPQRQAAQRLREIYTATKGLPGREAHIGDI